MEFFFRRKRENVKLSNEYSRRTKRSVYAVLALDNRPLSKIAQKIDRYKTNFYRL